VRWQQAAAPALAAAAAAARVAAAAARGAPALFPKRTCASGSLQRGQGGHEGGKGREGPRGAWAGSRQAEQAHTSGAFTWQDRALSTPNLRPLLVLLLVCTCHAYVCLLCASCVGVGVGARALGEWRHRLYLIVVKLR